MSDMDALFASRKKKGKKGKLLNMNQVLDQVDTLPVERQLVQQFDDDGNVISLDEVIVPKSVGGLTAAVNASKKKPKESDSVIAVKGADLVSGEWQDENEAETGTAPTTFLASAAKRVTALENLPSSMPEETKSREVLEEEERNRKMFHWTRKQALQEAEAVVHKPAEVEEKPKFFRPREMVQARAGGAAALKELDNEQVFPSLGGPTAKASAAKKSAGAPSVWGVVREEVIEDLQVKQLDGVYLGSEFMEAEEFGGAKPGYSFKLGHKGLGYYWEGPRTEVSPAVEAADAEQEAESEAAAQDQASAVSEETKAPAPAPVPGDAARQAALARRKEEEEARQREIDEEKERKRRAKKAEKERQKAEWEREQQLALEREQAEALKKKEDVAAGSVAAVPAPTSAAVEPPPPSDRFAGLKKKKKTKKPTEE